MRAGLRPQQKPRRPGRSCRSRGRRVRAEPDPALRPDCVVHGPGHRVPGARQQLQTGLGEELARPGHS